MNNIDKLQDFMKESPYWEGVLQAPPYNLTVKRDQGYILLKYNQITSDFSHPYVKAARGVIFDEENNYEVACRPFEKFFNWGEEEAAEIDWNSAFIQEKVDGSILKMWFSERLDQWVISTNGVIFGENVPVMFPKDGIETFGDMIKILPRGYWEWNSFDEDYTYIFELVGPQNRVVVPYSEIDMYFLTAFHNEIGEENRFDKEVVGFPRPKKYSFSSLEETIEFTKSKSFNTFKNEGFVVSDANSNRIKIKTEDYLRIHRLRGEAVPTEKKLLELVLSNEYAEFLAYYPEYTEQVKDIKVKLQEYNESLSFQTFELFLKARELAAKNGGAISRKELAEWIKTQQDPNYLFQFFDGKVIDLWIREQRLENVLKRIEG